MAAKVKCKKKYGAVEFKKVGEHELCPVSDAVCCEKCEAKVFQFEEAK